MAKPSIFGDRDSQLLIVEAGMGGDGFATRLAKPYPVASAVLDVAYPMAGPQRCVIPKSEPRGEHLELNELNARYRSAKSAQGHAMRDLTKCPVGRVVSDCETDSTGTTTFCQHSKS